MQPRTLAPWNPGTLEPSYVAIDLGASGGRVIRGRFTRDAVQLDEVHRFPNQPRQCGGHERWDFSALVDQIKQGLALLPDRGEGTVSVGVDTWGVDYGLLDAAGRLIDDPVCYRDPRTDGIVLRVLDIFPRADLFRATGIQVQPFNTIYQLAAQRWAGEWPATAERLLMMPDLFHHALCGSTSGEVTMASTTQLVTAVGREWAAEVFAALDLPLATMPPLVSPGTTLGTLTRALQAEFGLPALKIVAPATHDTASAVAGAPLEVGWAYLSSGTWSLLGVETPAPLLTGAAAARNLTNEAGVEGTNRLLQNIMGLWILESCRRILARQGKGSDYDALMYDVERAPAFRGIIDPDNPRFFHPLDMTMEVRAFLAETGQPDPGDAAALTRIVLESLALRYAAAIQGIETVTGAPVRGLRIIGGGSRNAFLNQATANATGLTVLAGPVEATALGNLVVQAIADGRFADVAEARKFVARSVPEERFTPRDDEAWESARVRFATLTARP